VYFAKSRGGNRDLNYNLRVTRTSLSAVMPTIIISSTQNKITPWTPSRYAHNTNFHHPKTSYSVGSELAQPENYPVVSFLQYTFKPDAHQLHIKQEYSDYPWKPITIPNKLSMEIVKLEHTLSLWTFFLPPQMSPSVLPKRMSHKGPSIYDIHTEGGRGQAQVDACGRGPAPCGRPHRKLNVIPSTFHAKKLVYFLLEFHLWTE